jgi:hypothetical protein
MTPAPTMTNVRKLRSLLAGAALAALALAPAAARAQDAGTPSPEEIKKKVLEIEKLMRGAEESLARATDTRSASERSAEAARKILEDMAQRETGKTPEQLRQEAAGGSAEAKETLERLTKAADESAREAAAKMGEVLGEGGGGASGSSQGAGEGIRKIIEKVRGEGQGASAGIRWLLDKTVQQGKGGGSPHEPKPKEKDEKQDPKKPEEKEKPKDQAQKPPQKPEPPRTPEFEQWIAELPPQVRKAYETEDWDAIPPKWRELLREWTKRMADEKAREGR